MACSCTAPETGISPWRAFERQVHMLRRIGDAEVEMDLFEKRIGSGRNVVAAIPGADVKHGAVASGGKRPVEPGMDQQSAVADFAFEQARQWRVTSCGPQL